MAKKTALKPQSTDVAAPTASPEPKLVLKRDESKTWHQQLADACLSPVTQCATTTREWSNGPKPVIGINEAYAVVQSRATDAEDGDLAAAKAMLMAQAKRST